MIQDKKSIKYYIKHNQYVITPLIVIVFCSVISGCNTKTLEDVKISKSSKLLSEPKGRRTQNALEYLSREMDYFHERTIIFDDFESGGERFLPTGWMKGPESQWPEQSDGRLKFTYPTVGAYQGASCLRVEWRPPSEDDWVAVAWQYPKNNWGDSRGLNLEGATSLKFRAKGETGREIIKFEFGIMHKNGKRHNDSCNKITTGSIRLSRNWKEYKIDLSSQNLTNIISGFCFAVSKNINPGGCVFYLDDISINHSRLNEPRLIRSYHMGERVLTKNRHIRNACFVYDNALAICAFLSSSSHVYHQRARLIADAFVELVKAEGGNFIRNAYTNGDLFNIQSENIHNSHVSRIPGYLHNTNDGSFSWYEDTYSKEIDCGNMAWAMLALLNVWEADGHNADSTYIKTAKNMGDWILKNTKDSSEDLFGFYGGKKWNEEKGVLEPVLWKSTEHNIDLAAVFARLANTDPEIENRTKWKDASECAKKFVLWAKENGSSDGGRLITGTKEGTDDPAMIPKPLDPQTWSVLAFSSEKHLYKDALDWAIRQCWVKKNGLEGVQFSAGEGDNIWPEGTAQLVLALKVLGENVKSNSIIQQLELIMGTTQHKKETVGAMPAAYPNYINTGFGWNYENLPHLGATAWYLLAANNWNPYSGHQIKFHESSVK